MGISPLLVSLVAAALATLSRTNDGRNAALFLPAAPLSTFNFPLLGELLDVSLGLLTVVLALY